MLFFIKQIEMIEITLISVVCVALLTAKATKTTETSFDKGRIIMNLHTGEVYNITKVEFVRGFRVVEAKIAPYIYNKEDSEKGRTVLDLHFSASVMKRETIRFNQEYYKDWVVFDDKQAEQVYELTSRIVEETRKKLDEMTSQSEEE